MRLTPEERVSLQAWGAIGARPLAEARRCWIVLALAKGHSLRRVSDDIGVSRNTVVRWRRQFLAHGCRPFRPGVQSKKSAPHIIEVAPDAEKAATVERGGGYE